MVDMRHFLLSKRKPVAKMGSGLRNVMPLRRHFRNMAQELGIKKGGSALLLQDSSALNGNGYGMKSIPQRVKNSLMGLNPIKKKNVSLNF